MNDKPAPQELTFYLNVYGDSELLSNCLRQLRQVYPQSRLVIRSDGDPEPTIAIIAQKYKGEFHYDERLMGIEKGGEIVHEMLRLFLADATDYLFKIDPDTRLVRPFKALPEPPCVFGTLQRASGTKLSSIQGGCIGITRDIAQQWYSSQKFLDPVWAEQPPPWAVNYNLRQRAMRNGLTSFDWTIGWACKEMGIELVDWPEITSLWQVIPENDDLRYAVTHPYKFRPTVTDDRPSVPTW